MATTTTMQYCCSNSNYSYRYNIVTEAHSADGVAEVGGDDGGSGDAVGVALDGAAAVRYGSDATDWPQSCSDMCWNGELGFWQWCSHNRCFPHWSYSELNYGSAIDCFATHRCSTCFYTVQMWDEKLVQIEIAR